MAGKYLLASILCLVLGNALGQEQQSVMEGTYNVTQVCTMVKTGTQLGSILSCSIYYVCTRSGPVMQTCSSGYAYNFRTQNCALASEVECYYGMSNPCAGVVGSAWVPNVKNCQGWYYCNGNQIGGHGVCDKGERFESASQRCIYGDCGQPDSDSDEPGLVNYCSVVPPNMYFGSTSDCQTWYYCNAQGLQTQGECASSAFIASSASCGYDTAPGACDRVVNAPVPTTCSTLNEIAPDPTTCGNYYVCNGEVYVLNSCPYGTYWDLPSQSCVYRKLAAPTSGCNRCQYATTPFVNAVDKTCDTYYYCQNGNHGAVSTCPTGFFFNEADQACAPNSGLSNYSPYNGACYNAGTPSGPPSPSDSTSGSSGDSSTSSGSSPPTSNA
ncbi:hypothetical protein ACLKA7_003706 [Drosophila subpalustris]